MPLLSEVLERARTHVAGGWHEPMSLDASGVICAPNDEGISRFCVSDALHVAAGGRSADIDAQVDAELELAAQLRHAGERRSLSTWLEDKHTLHGDVLRLMHTAAQHLRAEGR